MYTVQRETFEGENFRKFQGFVATHQSFLCKFWGCSVCWRHKQAIHDSFLRTNHIFHHFTRVFSLESFQYLQNILLKAATLLVQYCVTMAMAHDDLWLDFCTIKPILIWPLNFPPQRSDFGLVILDDLHRLVEYVQVGGQITVSHALLHALTTLLTTTPLAGVCVRVCVRACVCVCVHVCAHAWAEVFMLNKKDWSTLPLQAPSCWLWGQWPWLTVQGLRNPQLWGCQSCSHDNT